MWFELPEDASWAAKGHVVAWDQFEMPWAGRGVLPGTGQRGELGITELKAKTEGLEVEATGRSSGRPLRAWVPRS